MVRVTLIPSRVLWKELILLRFENLTLKYSLTLHHPRRCCVSSVKVEKQGARGVPQRQAHRARPHTIHTMVPGD